MWILIHAYTRTRTRCSPRRSVTREWQKVGETGNPRGQSGDKKREKEKDVPVDTKLENRGKVVPSPLSFPLYSPPFTPSIPRRHTGTFSCSFSMPSLQHIDWRRRRRRSIYKLHVLVVTYKLFMHLGILFVTCDVIHSDWRVIIYVVTRVRKRNSGQILQFSLTHFPDQVLNWRKKENLHYGIMIRKDT